MLNTLGHYSHELEEVRTQLEKVSSDETGARREHLLHRDLGRIISEKIEFTEEGAKLKPGKNDCFIVDITAIDMQYANSEHGYATGDEYLKKTVQKANSMFGERTGTFSLYHKNGQDFTGILDAFDIEHNFLNTQEKDILINGTEFRNSISIVKLSDIAEMYSRFAHTHTIEGSETDKELIRKRVFTDLLLAQCDLAREYKKITELGDDILLGKYPPETESEKFTKYIQYMFTGTRFEELEGFKQKPDEPYKTLRREFLNTCKNIAQRNVFGEKSDITAYWGVLLDNYIKEVSYRHESIATLISQQETESEETPPTETFKNFGNMHLTPKQKELRETKSAIGYLNDDIQQALKILQSEVASTAGTDHESNAIEFCKTLGFIKKQMKTANKFASGDVDQMIQDIENTGLTNPDNVSKLFLDHTQKIRLFDELQKMKYLADIAEVNFNIELCEYDYLTGLRNKQTCEKRLDEIHAKEIDSNSETNVISIDLGFLKYFNKKGNREIGNLAIQTAGFILQDCANQIEGLEIFRTGGDEFTILVHGNTEKITQTLEYLANATKEAGPIPGNGKEIDKYIPEALHFNVGYCLKSEAQEALEYLKEQGTRSFSQKDLERLDKDNPNFDALFYAANLAKAQKIIAGSSIETQKLESRAVYLKDMLLAGETERFYNVYPFSGKALQGIDPEEFVQIVTENPYISEATLISRIKELQGNAKTLSSSQQSILERLVVDFAQEKKVLESVES